MIASTKSVQLPGGPRLSYIEQGDALGCAVAERLSGRSDGRKDGRRYLTTSVLLHGFSESCRSFARLLPYLPPSLRVYAISQRGHGDPERPPAGYSPHELAVDLAAFMELANIEAAIVVGHSMGSSVAECFALDHPGRVRGLVLSGAFAGGWSGSPAATELWTGVVSTMTDPIDPVFVREFQQSTSLSRCRSSSWTKSCGRASRSRHASGARCSRAFSGRILPRGLAA